MNPIVEIFQKSYTSVFQNLLHMPYGNAVSKAGVIIATTTILNAPSQKGAVAAARDFLARGQRK
jgi:hypothetical protein